MKKKLSKLTFLAIVYRIAGYINGSVCMLAAASLAADYDDWGTFVKQKLICFTIILVTGFLAVFFSSLSDSLKKEVRLMRKKSKKTFASNERKFIMYDLKKTE